MSAPRLARRLLERFLRDPLAREVILGDLEEELHARLARGDRRGAVSRWYWWQALASLWSYRPARQRATASPPSGSGFRQDLRHGLRLMGRAPGFTATAALTLAVGIAATITVYSLVHAVLLRPLGYAEPERLALLGGGSQNGKPGTIGYETVLDWREQSRSFAEIALMRDWRPTLRGEQAERLVGARISANALATLGVDPERGRDFLAAEDHPDRRQVVLLTDGLWRRRFGADPNILGRGVDLDGRTFHVVGVLPPSFDATIFPRVFGRIEILAPLGYQRGQPWACRTCQHLLAFGRLAPGTSLAAAREEIAAIQKRLAAENPKDYSDAAVIVVSATEDLLGEARPVLLVLFGAVLCVLAIACANVASLLLARGGSRAREVSIRAALGAGSGRLVRQLLVENLLLSGLGGLLGLGLAAISLRLVVRLASSRLPRIEEAVIEPSVAGFALAVTVVAGLAFGLVPALGLARRSRGSTDWGRRVVGDGRGTLGRRALVVANVALAFVLLVATGLMVKSVTRLLGVDPGFDARGVLTLRLSFLGDPLGEDGPALQAMEQILERVSALPGVEAAAFAGQLPLSGDFDAYGMAVEGRAAERAEELFELQRYSVTPQYFATLRLPLLAGRQLEDADRVGGRPVLLLSETAARELFPGEKALGRRLRFADPDEPWRTVVGVVGDVRHEGLAAKVSPQMYLPMSQRTDHFVTLGVRSALPPSALAPLIRREIAAVSRDIPVYDVAPLTALAEATAARERFTCSLLSAFSLIALLLATVSLYGLISYLVEGRRGEVGVRVALGAEKSDVADLVLRPGLGLIGAGLGLGLGAALLLCRTLSSLLYEVSPFDPATYATIALLLGVAALLAHLAPLARALRIDPSSALRSE